MSETFYREAVVGGVKRYEIGFRSRGLENGTVFEMIWVNGLAIHPKDWPGLKQAIETVLEKK